MIIFSKNHTGYSKIFNITFLSSSFPFPFMHERNFFLLLSSAEKSGFSGQLDSSTVQLSRELNSSQQTISRNLKELEEHGFISRAVSPAGIRLSITDSGRKELRRALIKLQHVFEEKKPKQIKGTVKSGLGEGTYYTSLPAYQKQFEEKLGWAVFSGTLNFSTERDALDEFIHGLKMIYVEGFKTKQRTFGGIKCFKVKINDAVEGALILPDRSNIPRDEAELIARVSLRKKLSLENGSEIRISAEGIH